MILQTEKLQLIEWLVQIRDVETIGRIVELKRQIQVANYEAQLKPMTVEALEARLREGEADLAAGRIHDLDDVLAEFNE